MTKGLSKDQKRDFAKALNEFVEDKKAKIKEQRQESKENPKEDLDK
ncbi:MAG: hypothetical protein ACREAE_00170 [Nitrosopumilaceae archaeon]